MDQRTVFLGREIPKVLHYKSQNRCSRLKEPTDGGAVIKGANLLANVAAIEVPAHLPSLIRPDFTSVFYRQVAQTSPGIKAVVRQGPGRTSFNALSATAAMDTRGFGRILFGLKLERGQEFAQEKIASPTPEDEVSIAPDKAQTRLFCTVSLQKRHRIDDGSAAVRSKLFLHFPCQFVQLPSHHRVVVRSQGVPTDDGGIIGWKKREIIGCGNDDDASDAGQDGFILHRVISEAAVPFEIPHGAVPTLGDPPFVDGFLRLRDRSGTGYADGIKALSKGKRPDLVKPPHVFPD